MNRYSFVLPLFIASLSLPATAQPPAAAPQPASPVLEAGAVGEVVTLTAKIEAVDQQNRTIDVVGPLGRKVTLKVSDQVKNFAQVKAGDKVVMKYSESVALELTKGSSGMMTTTTSTGPMTAAAGGKPGVAEVNRITMDSNVKKVDKKKMLVLLQGPEGRYVEVKIKDPAMMKDIKVGDQVHAVFTEAMVVDVVAPAKK
jgi:Cu/Ag efflux protein CusF